MKSYFWLPIAVFFALFATAIYAGGSSAYWYVDSISLIIILGFTFIMLCTHYSPVEMGRAFRAGMEKTKDSTEKELHDALNFFKTMQALFILNGFLGTLYGWISILTSLGDKQQMGRGFAASILTILYAVLFIIMISLPFQSAIKKKMKPGS